jgi:LPXTG-site transpeptidase (sortase) family protein
MREDLLTQLPKPPELQPIPSAVTKFWQFASTVMLLGGFALIGMGGWLFIEQQIEALKPPPARILEVSLEDLVTETPTPPAVATGAAPTATPATQAGAVHDDEPLKASIVSPTTSPTAGDESTPPQNASANPTLKPVSEVAAELTAVADKLASEVFAPTATLVPARIVGGNDEASQGLTLADNPLVVVETETGSGQPTLTETGSLTDIDKPPALPIERIVAKSIGLDSKVTEVGWQQVRQDGVAANVWIVADYAAGWHKNSALPGQGGNIVLSGHHNINGEVFRYIVDLEPGDIVTLYDAQGSHDYVIEDKFIVKDKGEPEAVRRANARWIGPFNEERLTMVTCWPYTNNTHRAVVIGKPVGR